jgi:hypothetical protein
LGRGSVALHPSASWASISFCLPLWLQLQRPGTSPKTGMSNSKDGKPETNIFHQIFIEKLAPTAQSSRIADTKQT